MSLNVGLVGLDLLSIFYMNVGSVECEQQRTSSLLLHKGSGLPSDFITKSSVSRLILMCLSF